MSKAVPAIVAAVISPVPPSTVVIVIVALCVTSTPPNVLPSITNSSPFWYPVPPAVTVTL